MPAAPNSSGSAAAAPAKLPFRVRLKAWWEGYQVETRPKRKSKSKAAEAQKAKHEQIKPFERWDEDHLELLRAVWGGDFVTPGNKTQVMQLVKPFGLNPAMSMLELGSGMGGAARAMTQDFGVWVTGMESEKRLAEAAMALSEKAGLDKKAPVTHYDPDNFELKAKSYDCIFAKEAFFTIPDKTRLFKVIETGLKGNGQLIFTDYVLPADRPPGPGLESWASGEPQEPHLWSVEQYVDELTRCKLEVRIKEDITDSYSGKIVRAWADYMSAQAGQPVQPNVASALVEEVELWTRRAQALEGGDVQIWRFYALKKSRGSLLSDW